MDVKEVEEKIKVAISKCFQDQPKPHKLRVGGNESGVRGIAAASNIYCQRFALSHWRSQTRKQALIQLLKYYKDLFLHGTIKRWLG